MATTRSIQSNEAIMHAERRLLRAIFNNPELLDCSEISADLFLHGNARTVYASMESSYENGSEFSKDAILQTAADVDLNIDAQFIDDIIEVDTKKSIDDIRDAIKAVAEGRRRIVAMQTLKKAAAAIDNAPLGDMTVLEDVKHDIESVEESLAPLSEDTGKVYDMKGWLDRYAVDRAKRRNGRQYPFNNYVFDNLLVDGAIPGEFGIITASSGMGKSAMALNLMNSLIEVDTPVMMFSLEMALTPTADRLLSCRTEIPYIDFVRAKDESVFDDVQVRFEEERIALNKHPNFRICENASLSLNDIKKHVKKFQADIGQQYCIVIIDLLSMVADFSSLKGSANFSQVAEVGVNKFSAMCKELGIHGIGIVQLNRSNEIESVRKVEDLVKFRPSRSQVKNSAAYLERARWLIGMYRKKFWAEQCLEKEDYEDMEDIIEVITLKQSNGPLSSVEALFDGQTFSVLAIEDTVKEEQTDAIV